MSATGSGLQRRLSEGMRRIHSFARQFHGGLFVEPGNLGWVRGVYRLKKIAGADFAPRH